MVETRLVGYARVSTEDQNLDMQIAALKRAGVMDDNVHVDKASGVSNRRPGLMYALKDCRRGDTLVVWKLDRLTRSPPQLYRLIDELEAKGVGLRSLTEMLDTTTAIGKLVIGVAAAVAGFERDIISERTRAGLKAIREKREAQGEAFKWGRNPSLTEAQIVQIGKLLNRAEKPMSAAAAAKKYGVSRPTVAQHWKRNPAPDGPRFVRQSKAK
jgi:DNA invertase Pin-like site-specific DNA recombinase